MSNKYSSDDKMQKLFEGFRRSLNENEDEANEGLNLRGSSAPKKGLNLMSKQSDVEARLSAIKALAPSISLSKAIRALRDVDENPELLQDPDMGQIYDTIAKGFEMSRSGEKPTEEEAAAFAQALQDLESRKQASKQAKMQSLEEAINPMSARSMGSVEVQCDGPGILAPNGELRLELMVGEEVFPVIAQLDEVDTEDILAAGGNQTSYMESKSEDK